MLSPGISFPVNEFSVQGYFRELPRPFGTHVRTIQLVSSRWLSCRIATFNSLICFLCRVQVSLPLNESRYDCDLVYSQLDWGCRCYGCGKLCSEVGGWNLIPLVSSVVFPYPYVQLACNCTSEVVEGERLRRSGQDFYFSIRGSVYALLEHVIMSRSCCGVTATSAHGSHRHTADRKCMFFHFNLAFRNIPSFESWCRHF